MASEEYPLELTEEEADLGFQRLWIEGFAVGNIYPKPVPVIARVMSSYDVLIKCRSRLDGEIHYTHQRHGYRVLGGEKTRTDWRPMSGPHKDARMFLHEYELDLRKDVWRDVVGVPFVSKPA